jgi:Transposase DDE domain
MPPRIRTILPRLRNDVAACLSPETIKEVCHSAGHRWRNRALNPVTTVYLFLLQILHGNTACQHVVHFGIWRFSESAYCQARKRLPLVVFQKLLEQITAKLRQTTRTSSLWLGRHRVWIVDGSSFSMSDVEELQQHFGQPGGQRLGCGFPVAKFLALVDVATGMISRVMTAPLRSHELSRVAQIHDALQVGDILMGDRGFCSFAHLALLVQKGVHAVFRIHQQINVDFTPRRTHFLVNAKKKQPTGLPRSRWERALGLNDQIVTWFKPKKAPAWMTPEQFASLPDEITVRELRYRVETRGFRTREITLVTTLLDAEVYSAEALADLYYRRWQVETNYKDLKITMEMDVLHCKTVEGVLKELAVFALAYNLVRSVMVEAARAQGVLVTRISVQDTVRWLIGEEAETGAGVKVIKVNRRRSGRVEPRVTKRRPKQYLRMTAPRSVLRKRLLEQNVAA